MSMDEFYKGAQMFLQGMGQLAQSNALDRAKTKLEEINTQQLDQFAKREAQTQLAQQIQFDFMKAQASAADTQQAGQLFAPKQFSNADAVILEGTLSNNPKLIEMGKAADLATMQPQMQLAEMQATAAEKRMEASQAASFKRQEISMQAQKEKQSKTVLSDRQKEYNRLIKTDLEAVSKADLVTNIINSKNPLGDNTLPSFFTKASGEVGALSEADKAPFGGSKALDAKLARWASIQVGGTIPESDRKDMRLLAKLLRNRSASKIKEQTLQSAGQISQVIGGSTEEHTQNLLGASTQLKGIFDQNSDGINNNKPNIKKYLSPTQ